MKKIFLIVFLCLFAFGCYAQEKTYSLKNRDMVLSLIEVSENNLVVSELTNTKTGKNMIVEPKRDEGLWSFQIRKGYDEATNLELKPVNAEKMSVKRTQNKLEILWSDVKAVDMEGSFDVIATIKSVGEDSLWSLSIKSKENEYGLWTIKYPIIGGIDATKPSRVTYPVYGGQFDDDFKGYYESHYPSIYMPMQWTFVTKDNTTL